MTLFDDITRHGQGPANYAEPDFPYLNRSARQDVTKIRDVLDDWFSRYPSIGKKDLRGRFRSKINTQHRSAFFELFLHELLLRLGCRVKIHPGIKESTRRHPDFLVGSPRYGSFYLEATLATDETVEKAAARLRMNEVYDTLNRLNSPNFFIGMNIKGSPRTPPPAKQIRSFLEKKIHLLDPDEIATILKSGGIKALPHWHYRYGEWEIDFYPIPKSPNLRGMPGVRTVGIRFYGVHWSNSRAVIRKAIVSKSKRYGILKLPLVIAVNALGEYVDRTDVMDALFGKEQFIVQLTRDGNVSEPEMTRAPDGTWTSKKGPRYTRVNAVLIAISLFPWNIPRANIRLYHNPYTKKRFESELTRLPQAIPQDDHMILQDGGSLETIFGLPPGWPES